MSRIAFNTSRKSTSIGRPAFDARGRKGSIRAHSSSVKSLGYRLVFFSILAIRPRIAGVHIPSLNHGRKPHSTTFQTDSYKIVSTSSDSAPWYAAAQAGLAVTVSLPDEVPDGLRPARPDDRLPELPEVNLLLLKAREPRQPVTDVLYAH